MIMMCFQMRYHSFWKAGSLTAVTFVTLWGWLVEKQHLQCFRLRQFPCTSTNHLVDLCMSKLGINFTSASWKHLKIVISRMNCRDTVVTVEYYLETYTIFPVRLSAAPNVVNSLYAVIVMTVLKYNTSTPEIKRASEYRKLCQWKFLNADYMLMIGRQV